MQLVIYYMLLISGIQARDLLNYKKLYKYFKYKNNNCTSESSTITQLPISHFHQTKQSQQKNFLNPNLYHNKQNFHNLNHNKQRFNNLNKQKFHNLNKMVEVVIYKVQVKLLFILELVLMWKGVLQYKHLMMVTHTVLAMEVKVLSILVKVNIGLQLRMLVLDVVRLLL